MNDLERIPENSDYHIVTDEELKRFLQWCDAQYQDVLVVSKGEETTTPFVGTSVLPLSIFLMS